LTRNAVLVIDGERPERTPEVDAVLFIDDDDSLGARRAGERSAGTAA
jgi:hypothetical protein